MYEGGNAKPIANLQQYPGDPQIPTICRPMKRRVRGETVECLKFRETRSFRLRPLTHDYIRNWESTRQKKVALVMERADRKTFYSQ